MQIARSQVMDLLRAKGDDTQVGLAELVFPETVDTGEDSFLLAKFGIARQDVKDQLDGGL